MSSFESSQVRRTAKKWLVRIPFVYLMVTVGFLFEFMLGLPFMVICMIETGFRRGRS